MIYYNWYSEVAYILSFKLHDKNLIKEIIKILKPLERKFQEKKSKKFYSSLKNDKKNDILFSQINFFIGDFIKNELSEINLNGDEIFFYENQKISQKIKTVNLIFDNSMNNKEKFNGRYRLYDIKIYLQEYKEIIDFKNNEDNESENRYPIIVTFYKQNNRFIGVRTF